MVVFSIVMLVFAGSNPLENNLFFSVCNNKTSSCIVSKISKWVLKKNGGSTLLFFFFEVPVKNLRLKKQTCL